MMLSFLNWDNIQRHHQAWVLSSAGRASPLQKEAVIFSQTPFKRREPLI